MEVLVTGEYQRFRQRVIDEDRARATGGIPVLLAMEAQVVELVAEPTQDSATFKRVRQATRHRLWPVAHPFRPQVALRIILWFPDPHTVVLALLGHHKAQSGDAWFGCAARNGEAIVDEYLRKQER